MLFLLRISPAKVPADFVTFTEEIPIEKHFFVQWQFVLVVDVNKAFLNIEIDESDRNYLRLL